MLIDEPCALYPMAKPEKQSSTVSKSMLYSDYFNGFLDATVVKGGGEHFSRLADKLWRVAKSSRKLGYLFDTQAKLCRVLSVKYELGVKTRAAYKAGDKGILSKIANEDYPLAIRRLTAFMGAVEKQWLTENKRQGLDVQHIRLGGVKTRLEFCRKSLLSYLAGEMESIPELEEEILPWATKEKSTCWNSAIKTMTVGAIW